MSSYRTRIIPTIVIALASMIDAGTAFAFEGLHTTTGAPMRWKGSSIAMEVDESLGSLVGGREAIQGAIIARTLEEDDEAGAIDIYGQGFPELKSAFECSIGRGPGTGRDAGALVALLLLGVALSRRRARRVLGLATALVIVGLAIQSCVLANSSASMHVGASVAGPCELDVPPQVTVAGGPRGRDAASQLTLRPTCRGAEQILSIDHAPAANDVRKHHAPSSVEAISEPVVVTVLL